jgi:lipoprotein-anchoring transpeptidase ErfK/SrfK
MGFPTSDEYPAYSGQRQDFQFGSILWSPTTGSWTLGGAIGAHYKALGAQSSWLGFPIGREYAVGGSIQQDFQRGSIVWSPGQAATAVEGGKWIDVNLSNQTLTAFVGQSVAFGPVSISSGLVFRSSTGTFTVYAKRALQDMRGINPNGTTYVQPSVPWILYYNGGEALHGAYWHNNFGHPMSHGCINMRVEEARAIYNWAPVGTVVKVHY